MYNHPTAEQLEQYSDRTLPANVFDMIQKHVIWCASCREKCISAADEGMDYNKLLEALLPSKEDAPYHLSYELVAAYIDRDLDEVDFQMVESHLQVCHQCMEDVNSLREFADERSTGAAAQALKKEEPDIRSSVPESYKPVPQHLKRAAAAAIAAVLLLALVVLWFKTQSPVALTGDSENVNSGNNDKANNQAPAGNGVEAEPSPLPNPNTPEDTSQATLLLNDGEIKITLDIRGKLGGLDHLPEALLQAVKSALTTQKIEVPQILADLKGEPSIFAGPSGDDLTFRLISPVGEVVRSDQPTLRWSALPGANSYRVVVTDPQLNEVALSESVTATAWKVSKRLERGAVYSWQVTALKEGKEITAPVLPEPQAKFKVLGQSQAEELKRMTRIYPRSHLLLSVIYARAGLLAESRRELQLLVKDNPNSTIARNLLRSIRQ